MNKYIMHVNYGEVAGGNYGNKTVDDVCRLAAESGYDGIEFRADVPKTKDDLDFNEYVDQIAKGKKKYGLSEILFGVGVAPEYDATKEERAQVIQKAQDVVRIIHDKCETTLCNASGKYIKSPLPGVEGGDFHFHGSAAATQEHWDIAVDTFQQMAKVLEPLGVKFALETHMNYIHDLPEASKKFIDLIDSPNIGVNMDYGNTVYFPVFPDVESVIDLYGDKLFYTHLKNSIKIPGVKRNVPVALSEGMINHRLYLTKLKESGFTGCIGIEAPRPGDRAFFATSDLDYIKSIWKDINY